jgi:hypothetical protein
MRRRVAALRITLPGIAALRIGSRLAIAAPGAVVAAARLGVAAARGRIAATSFRITAAVRAAISAAPAAFIALRVRVIVLWLTQNRDRRGREDQAKDEGGQPFHPAILTRAALNVG